MAMSRRILLILFLFGAVAPVRAEPPAAAYIFPAGGQQGKTVAVKVGGIFLHSRCGFEMLGPGVKVSPKLERTKTIWFEGSLLPLPDSQRQEDYPKDMAGQVSITADAPLGVRYWRLWTSQGATPVHKFVIGDLPEVIEDEIDGDPVPVRVTMPVTVNGRIFPREDVDIWTVSAKKGQSVLCRADVGRLGSPLEPRLEVRDPHGRPIAESDERYGNDPVVRFVAAEDGDYQVRIHDSRFQGGQAFVYRLTMTSEPQVLHHYPLGGKRGSRLKLQLEGANLGVKEAEVDLPAIAAASVHQQLNIGGKRTNPILLEVDDLPEHLEGTAAVITVPAICNGRIDKPGEIDAWSWSGKKGEALIFDLRAGRLGSFLDGILTVHDDKGKELARVEAAGAMLDPILQFTAPADGTYQIRVQDRFRTRGGDGFAYRLRIERPPSADFRLTLLANTITLPRKGKSPLKVAAERLGGFKEAIEIKIHGLPAGVTATPLKLAPGQATVDLQFQADANAAIGISHLKIEGSATIGKELRTRVARLAMTPGAPELESLLLAVALPTPFKIKGEYVMGFAPRGSVLQRKYKIEREGYDGPIEIRLTDKQARHLQGATGPVMMVPPKESAFTYGTFLPPWMDVGRTARVCVMGTAVLKEPDGSEHEVSYSSVHQNDQLVAVVGPGQLSLELERTSLGAEPGKTMTLPVRIRRGQGLQGPVKVELVAPDHIRGVSAATVEIPADRENAELIINCQGKLAGPWNMPFTVRAVMTHQGNPVTGEATLEIVPRP